MQVATYSRVSTAHDQDPAAQVAELRRYCEARGWSIAHEIADHGYSGSTDNRPGLKQLFGLARRREIDVVCVVKMDRVFRSLKHMVAVLEELGALGVLFVAVRDAVDYSTPQGRLFAQVLASLAEFEKALIRERTLMGLDHARRSGKTLGRPKLRNDEAIRALRAQGLSYGTIARKLAITKSAVYRALKAVAKSGQNPAPNCPDKSERKNG